MAVFTASERAFVDTLGRLIDCNPFRPERVELERAALGKDFIADDANWNLEPKVFRRSQNVLEIGARARALVDEKASSRATAATWDPQEHQAYLDLVDYTLFSELADEFAPLIGSDWAQAGALYALFEQRLAELEPAPLASRSPRDPAHLFAIHFQLYRAFRNIFDHLMGSSTPVIALRSAVWESIFSRNLRRHRDLLFARMGDFSTLITGPSGTGKELVARAIGLSTYVPFDTGRQRFAVGPESLFVALNLSALNPTLIESELFGHKKGAFTGAHSDRAGWLESCHPYGAVFLDEIGELSGEIQVKMLRVIQERSFQRLGDAAEIPFQGKLIAATNCDLPAMIHAGDFRRDFYYRICSDQIETPSLAERCQADDSELLHLTGHLLSRILQQDATELAGEVVAWITDHLGPSYPWPGNVRELEQCIRGWLLREDYRPVALPSPSAEGLEPLLQSANFTAEELISAYCRAKHKVLGSYQAVGKALDLDRRTVKARMQVEE